jgi:hypothetical protein
MSASKWVHVEADILEVTDKAILIEVVDIGSCWIPKSQLDEPDRYEVGDVDIIVSMTRWIANEKGLESDE